ncbi:MAG TPA: AbrB/MazE/SpoVT family DNA-binding domain-containing protein [Candidatus Solibacter sp.]|jgi:AbrB family looped-hinge helix DNA binding protein|nr:AbrB/MazE/SpoVT family DNA-binding domain-containing protein [Candidatus Solibacter sp.]
MAGKTILLEKGLKAASLSRIGQRREVVIPKAIFDRLHLREGDLMEITADAGRVSMKPKTLAGADDVLTPDEARKVRHGLRQAREGKTKPLAQVKHELGL